MRLAVFHMLPSGGGHRVVRRLVEDLGKRYELTVHVPDGAAEMALPPHIRVVRHPFPEGRRLSGARRLAAPLVLIGRLYAFARLCRRIAGLINGSSDAALVHNTMVLAAPPLLESLEIPSLYYCFEYPRHIYEPRIVRRTGTAAAEVLLAPLRSRERRMDSSAARSASAVAVLSSYMRKRFGEVYGIEAEVIRPGVDQSCFRPPGDTSGPRGGFVLSVGALWPFKGHELAVSAIASLQADRRPRLLIVSDREFPGHAGRIEGMASSLGVDLTIRRAIQDSELTELYRRAAAVLCCQHREPYGMVPLEAMASGCPVIAVDEGGFRDNVSDGITGLLVERDQGAVSGALERILTEPGLAEGLAGTALGFVRSERRAEDTEKQLAALLDSLR